MAHNLIGESGRASSGVCPGRIEDRWSNWSRAFISFITRDRGVTRAVLLAIVDAYAASVALSVALGAIYGSASRSRGRRGTNCALSLITPAPEMAESSRV